MWCALLLSLIATAGAQDMPALPDPGAFPADGLGAQFDTLADHFAVGMGWDHQRMPAHLREPLGGHDNSGHVAWLRQMRAAFASIDARQLDTTRFIDHRLVTTFIAGQLAAFDEERPDRFDAAWYVPDLKGELDTIRKTSAPDQAATRMVALLRQLDARITGNRLDAEPRRDRVKLAAERLAALGAAFRNVAARAPAAGLAGWDRKLDEWTRWLAGLDKPGHGEPGEAEQRARRAREFRRRIRYVEHITLSPEELNQMARDEIVRIEERLREAAHAIGPRPWRDVVNELKTHTLEDAGEVKAFAEDTISRATAFLRATPLIPLPDRLGDLTVRMHAGTPDKGYAIAWYNPLEPRKTGYCNLELMPPGTPEGAERLRELHRERLQMIVLHEAVPGHHLQFAIAGDVPPCSTIRQHFQFLSSYFEGWALYGEQLMAEVGFLATPQERIAQLMMRMWRAVRVLVDVGLNAGGMNENAAMKLLTDVAMLEPASAAAEVRRHQRSPGQRLSYLYGALQLDAMRDELKQRLGSRFSLLDFHHRVLDDGPLPMRLLRARVLGDRVGPIDAPPPVLPAFPREWLQRRAETTPYLASDNQWRAPGLAATNLGVGTLRVNGGDLAVQFPAGTLLPPSTLLTVFGHDGTRLAGMVMVRSDAPPDGTLDARSTIATWPVTTIATDDQLDDGLQVAWGAGLPRSDDIDNNTPAAADLLALHRETGNAPARGVWAAIEPPGNTDADIREGIALDIVDSDGRVVGRISPHSPLAGMWIGRVLPTTPDAVFGPDCRILPNAARRAAVAPLARVELFSDGRIGTPPAADVVAVGTTTVDHAPAAALRPDAVWGVYDPDGERVATFTIHTAGQPAGSPVALIGYLRYDNRHVGAWQLVTGKLRIAWPSLTKIDPLPE
ncbi:MAG: DUF885 domain-containing protein [Planctomycetota bacterium]